MTDIQQWRRKIQPARARTPATDLEDASINISPVTPREPLRPKFTTNFTQHQRISLDEDPFPSGHNRFRKVPSWITEPPAPNPDVDQLVDSFMCNVLGDPHNGLRGRYTSDLMQIFEAYRTTKDDMREALRQLDAEIQRRRCSELAWSRERDEYKADVKRLELLLSEGKRGLAEVTFARQDSVLKRGKRCGVQDDSGLETILKNVEKTSRNGDKAWSAQRATMRNRSPSSRMRRLSRSLAAKPSTTNAHSQIPCGTLPSVPESFLQRADNNEFAEAPVGPEVKTRVFDDNLSAFSDAGDLLPDEYAHLVDSITTGLHEDAAPNRLRQANQDVTPMLLDAPPLQRYLQNLGTNPYQTSYATGSLPPAIPLRKTPTMRSKASGFLAKFKPQLTGDMDSGRGFSFEMGDDADVSSGMPPVDSLPFAVRDRLLRKSASMSTLEAKVHKSSQLERPLAPVAQSPTTSPTSEWFPTPLESSDPQRRSKIPTPIHHYASLARPRQEREDSSSSLLTAIRHPEDASLRSNSLPSSAFSSPSGSRIDMTRGTHEVGIVQASSQRTTRSNHLLEHTNSLRGSRLAAAAARTAALKTHVVDPKNSPDVDHPLGVLSNSNNSRVSVHAGRTSDCEMIQKENHHPMR